MFIIDNKYLKYEHTSTKKKEIMEFDKFLQIIAYIIIFYLVNSDIYIILII